MIRANLLEQQSCQISSQCDLKWRRLRLFKKVTQQEEEEKTITTRWYGLSSWSKNCYTLTSAVSNTKKIILITLLTDSYFRCYIQYPGNFIKKLIEQG